jgi:hypothetical protein
MLMGNAQDLQTVAANIDRDVFEVAMIRLADLVLLSDTTGILTGSEDIYVQGVNVAVQRETQRQRQLEFLQHTSNPMAWTSSEHRPRRSALCLANDWSGRRKACPRPRNSRSKRPRKGQTAAGNSDQVDKGIQTGVEQGQKLTAELTQGFLSRAKMPGDEEEGAEGGPPGMGGPPVDPRWTAARNGHASGGPPGMGPHLVVVLTMRR